MLLGYTLSATYDSCSLQHVTAHEKDFADLYFNFIMINEEVTLKTTFGYH